MSVVHQMAERMGEIAKLASCEVALVSPCLIDKQYA